MAPTMLEELCKRIQHCCTTLRRSRDKIRVGSCWLKSLTGFELCATTTNNMQQNATLLANNSQHFWMLHVASVCTPCCMFLPVVAERLKLVKLFSQQLPIFLLFRDRRRVAQQCWIRLHSSSNILGDVASVCTPLPTRTQQLPTLLAQQCWELLRLFARILTNETNYNHYVILICFSV